MYIFTSPINDKGEENSKFSQKLFKVVQHSLTIKTKWKQMRYIRNLDSRHRNGSAIQSLLGVLTPYQGHNYGLPWWLRWGRICLWCRRHGFDSWVGKIPWRRAWLFIAVFMLGEFHGQKSLVGYSLRGRKELDKTE